MVLNGKDDPGRAHAEARRRCPTGVAKRVRRLDIAEFWPDAPKGGDISDWIAAGHTRHELKRLIEAAPDYEPAPAPPGPPPSTGAGKLTTDDFHRFLPTKDLARIERQRDRPAGPHRLR